MTTSLTVAPNGTPSRAGSGHRSTAPSSPPPDRTRRLARTAGLLYLTIVVFGLFAEIGVRAQLVERGDPTATAANIIDNATLFRIGFAADLVVFLCDVAIAVVLYQLLRPIDQTLSLLAAAFRMTQTAIIGLNLLHMFDALRILDDSDYLSTFGADQTDALAQMALDSHRYGYILGLTFFGVSTVAIAALARRSGRFPRLLPPLLFAAGVGYVADSFMHFGIPGYHGGASALVLAPALVAEVWFCGWLLTRGRVLDSGPVDRRPGEATTTVVPDEALDARRRRNPTVPAAVDPTSSSQVPPHERAEGATSPWLLR